MHHTNRQVDAVDGDGFRRQKELEELGSRRCFAQRCFAQRIQKVEVDILDD